MIPDRIVPTSFRRKGHEYQTQVRRHYPLEVELSPLAIIELCLNDQHEITQIKGICVAKGARSCLRFISIEVYSYIGNNFDDSRELELSGEESDAFNSLFEKDLTSKTAKEHFGHQCIVSSDQIHQDRLISLSWIRSQELEAEAWKGGFGVVEAGRRVQRQFSVSCTFSPIIEGGNHSKTQARMLCDFMTWSIAGCRKAYSRHP